MLAENLIRDQLAIEANDRAYQEWYETGFDDAIHPDHRARYNHDAYLEGFVAGLKTLPQTIEGTIAYPKPIYQLANNYYESDEF